MSADPWWSYESSYYDAAQRSVVDSAIHFRGILKEKGYYSEQECKEDRARRVAYWLLAGLGHLKRSGLWAADYDLKLH